MNLSKISLNLLTEEVYVQGLVNTMYENIMKEEVEPKEKHLVKKVADDFKLNADFIFTYSAGISGFIGPVKTLLENKGISITEYDVTLLLVVVFYILLTKSNEDIKKLMDEIKSRDLNSEVKPVLRFVTKTVGLFKIVGKKFGIVIQSLTDILAFTFLSIPVMSIMRDLADAKGFNIDRVDDLLMGLTLSAGAYAIKNVIKR
jgi:hypothetical protein